MKLYVPLLSLALIGATPPGEQPAQADRDALLSAIERQEVLTPDAQQCRDRIHTVREQRGLPRVDRRAVSPDEPLLFYAVDRDIDGCDVLVMADGEGRDVRPLPAPQQGPLLQRAQ